MDNQDRTSHIFRCACCFIIIPKNTISTLRPRQNGRLIQSILTNESRILTSHSHDSDAFRITGPMWGKSTCGFTSQNMELWSFIGKLLNILIELPGDLRRSKTLLRRHCNTLLTSRYSQFVCSIGTMAERHMIKYCMTSLVMYIPQYLSTFPINSFRPNDAYMRQWSDQHWFR